MASWASRRGARQVVTRRVDPRPFVAFALLTGLLGFYAYQHWTATPASPLIGRARVLDGDSLEISGARIRLEGIDAPEWRQTCVDPKGQTWSCGQTAAQELRSYIGGRELTCARHGVDRYNRILATCSMPDGSDLNAWIIRQGWAVASGDAGHYRSEQHEAEAAQRGVRNIPAAAGVATTAFGMTTSGIRGFLLPQAVDALASAAGGLYHRIVARDPADRSRCYLFDR
jgi:endonuclease YncB( thermonuclease family)